MKKLHLLFFLGMPLFTLAQAPDNVAFSISVSVSPQIKNSFIKGGRLILHLSKQNDKEPRTRNDITVGLNPIDWDGAGAYILATNDKNAINFGLNKLSGKTPEKYYFQLVYKQNTDEAQENVAGNLYSNTDSAVITPGLPLRLTLNQLMLAYAMANHPHAKMVEIKSQYLSDFEGKPRFLKAAVLLPSGYFNHPDKTYPICYRAGGLNGRFTKINELLANKVFTDYWFSATAPQIIYVFLDSRGPYGDTYQVDSDNNGPCGKALTEELIPEIEKQFRYKADSKMRFLTGNSTGGWVALGLQVLYPDFFDGAWAYSPDPVDFSHFGLINIYEDESIFFNRFGYLQPGRRTIYGEPTFSMKDWITTENTGSRTGNYLVSGGQFGAYNAAFGPKGKDALPSLLFDAVTGKIDHEIAHQWEKYDLKKVLEKNWPLLGPKLQGKIWIWTGDMDGLYSNVATRFLQTFLNKTQNPKSDAHISFTPMAGHGQEWSDKAVLTLIAEKLAARTKNE